MNIPKSIQKTDALTVLLHWSMAIAIGFSLATGLQITADNPDSSWAKMVSALLFQGNVVKWHTWASLAVLFITIAYIAYLLRARLQTRIALDSTRINNLKSGDHQMRWKSINVLINWVAFVLVIVAAISGILLYFFSGTLPHGKVSSVHEFVSWAIIAYVVVHVVAQLIFGGWRHLLKIVNPQFNYLGAAVSALVIASLVGAGIIMADKASIYTLEVGAISSPPKMDGIDDDAVWQNAKAVTIATQRGMNLPGGEVAVTVKMAHDDTNMYALFEWPDTTRSQKHLPLVKTEKGWKVMQSEFYKQDEDDYYEDKFAVMLGRTPAIAGAGTAHYGKQPLEDKPGALGGRGLHYTTDGSIVDVWHWKSVRTGASSANQMDDNYFGPPLEVDPKKKRYTGGYTQDPGTGGGYAMNWEKFDRGTITPRWLPKDASVLERMGNIDLSPASTDKGEFWVSEDMMVEYSEELDTYPVGTIMPSVLVKGPREGDRGDVQGYSQWKGGRWVLEVSRKLDTQSKYDVAFNKDEPLYMWLGVFDHTQTRHSQHLHPVKIIML